MLKPEQRKWVEDNYDLVEWAVMEYSNPEDINEQEEIEALASILVCECLEGLSSLCDARYVCACLLQKLIPMQRRINDLVAVLETPVFDVEADNSVDWGYYEE